MYQVNGKHCAAKSERSSVYLGLSHRDYVLTCSRGQAVPGASSRGSGQCRRSSAAEPEAPSPGGCAVTAAEWELGAAPGEHLQHGAGSGRVRQEPACGCLHLSTEMDPKIRKTPTGYFEWHSPGLYTVRGVMGALSVFLDNLMSCCNEGSTEPLICMQFPHEMWILNSSKYESAPLTPTASLYISILTSSTAPNYPHGPVGSPTSLSPQ